MKATKTGLLFRTGKIIKDSRIYSNLITKMPAILTTKQTSKKNSIAPSPRCKTRKCLREMARLLRDMDKAVGYTSNISNR